MERLRSRDLRALLDFLRDVYALRDSDAFTAHVVSAIRRVIPSDRSAYSNLDLRRRVILDVTDPHLPEAARPVFARHMHEHPLVDYYRRTGDPGAYKVSDFLTRRQFQRLALYTEYLRPFLGGVNDQLACTFAASATRVTGVSMGRTVSEFSERERLLLNLLRPHLIQASENARAVDRMSADFRRLREGVEVLDRGLVFLGPTGRVRLATARAREWFAGYFGTPEGAVPRLPEAMQRWVSTEEATLTGTGDPAPPRAPFVMEREGRRLVARLVACADERAVLLEEQRTAQPADLARLGLSRRESEVLAWVSHGKTNPEIAILLGAKTRTVEKHLERIYRKLGVETRTAAAALVHNVL